MTPEEFQEALSKVPHKEAILPTAILLHKDQGEQSFLQTLGGDYSTLGDKQDPHFEAILGLTMAAQSKRSAEIARYQVGELGVDTAHAVRLAVRWPQWSFAYWFFIGAPAVAVGLLLWAPNVVLMAWKLVIVAIALVLFLRLRYVRWHRADEMPRYSIGSKALIALGGVLMLLAPLAYVGGYALQDAVLTEVMGRPVTTNPIRPAATLDPMNGPNICLNGNPYDDPASC